MKDRLTSPRNSLSPTPITTFSLIAPIFSLKAQISINLCKWCLLPLCPPPQSGDNHSKFLNNHTLYNKSLSSKYLKYSNNSSQCRLFLNILWSHKYLWYLLLWLRAIYHLCLILRVNPQCLARQCPNRL